jgi:nucleoid-associated protein YgaU
MPYVIQSGDTLWLMAVREYGSGLSWPVIFEGNRDTLTDPNLIRPGQVLFIPVQP